ncbi:MAG: GNAT family N-acetyltransferase [Candidatus Hodarchaeales archaeon]
MRNTSQLETRVIRMKSNISKRPSVKLRRAFFHKDSTDTATEKKHKYYVLKMSWDQADDVSKEISDIVEKDEFLKKVLIRPVEEKDEVNFIRAYNRSFITAPDPYRSLANEDFKLFDPRSTFVAILYGQIVGFIFLTIEDLIKNSEVVGKQGVIAGLGVDPRYRRRKIAFLLAAQAATFFSKHCVDELVCEVYYLNKVSYSFIQNFGMTRTGTIYL